MTPVRLEPTDLRSRVKHSITEPLHFLPQMEKKWTIWYAITSHVIAYCSKALLFGTHAFNFNCFLDDFNCVFTQIRCLSALLGGGLTPLGFGPDRIRTLVSMAADSSHRVIMGKTLRPL